MDEELKILQYFLAKPHYSVRNKFHSGQNRPHFFSKIHAEKNGQYRCSASIGRLLRGRTIVIKQYNPSLQYYLQQAYQTNEVQGISVMMNELKEV